MNEDISTRSSESENNDAVQGDALVIKDGAEERCGEANEVTVLFSGTDEDAAETRTNVQPQSVQSSSLTAEPISFPLTDDEFTAKSLEESFPITDDEFTAKSLEEHYPPSDSVSVGDTSESEGRQTSISDIYDKIPELEDVNAPIAVQIPEDDEDEQIIQRAPKKKEEPKTRPIDNRFDFLELFVFTLVAVLILTTFIFRHSIVDGGSMEKTLYDGEHLIISDFFYTPKRGDIIVFQDYSKAKYSTALSKPLVKRVIAIGGDTVRVYRSGKVYVNDMTTPIDESEYNYTVGYVGILGNYADADIPNFTYFPDKNYPEYIECTVPEGEVFVMGDHRDASTDSRAFGTVSCETILGRVLLRFYPFESFGKVE